MKIPTEHPQNQMELDVGPQPGSQLLSKILTPAVRLWLRSQIESAAVLEFQISGRDRQLLRGQIPAIQVDAAQVVYQGLHLNLAQLTASQIQINLGQVIQGKPLRLLQPVPVIGQLCLTQTDLTASSESVLLRQALHDLIGLLLPAQAQTQAKLAELPLQNVTLQYPNLVLGQGQVTLTTELVAASPGSAEPQRWHLTLQFGLRLVKPAQLQFDNLTLELAKLGQPASQQSLPPLEIDLGPAVNLQQLEITPSQVTCVGQVELIPV